MAQKTPETEPLQILNDFKTPKKEAIKTLNEFIDHLQFPLEEKNKQELLIKLDGLPIIRFIDIMVKDSEWASQASQETIKRIDYFLTILKKHKEDEQIKILAVPREIKLDQMSNQQLRTTLSLEYNQTKSYPKTWYKVDHMEIRPTILVRIENIKNKKDETIGQQTTRIVKEYLENTEDDIGRIVSIEPGREVAKIKCLEVPDRTQLYNYLQTKQPQWISEIPCIVNPQILIQNVKFDARDANNWIERFFIKNRLNREKRRFEMKILHHTKGIGQLRNLFIEVCPSLRELIQSRFGEMFVGLQMVHVKDYFNINLCRKCTMYGHTTTRCNKITKCPYDGEVHLNQGCPIIDQPSKWRCPNCLKFGHCAWDVDCQVYQSRLKAEIEKRNFKYTWIMN
ncbi:uncharacterized protein LOC128393070 [Panonychus citri]|uniref:uncharacterized protein LOC128393070 n=1 Tax=Panonychus citri TaxID=50023 RepID=UPI00230766F5|nr:uncharacterized protein LOC128393070 [Panonychus citri]